MNAHSHTDFTENARDSRGRFLKSETPLPSARYELEIVESDVIQFGDSTELQFRAQVVGGPYRGRDIEFRQRITAEFQIDDEDYEAAAQYGGPDEREFVALRAAADVRDLQDTQELHSKPFSASVSFGSGAYRVDGIEKVTTTPKAAKPTPARGPDGRFLPRQDAKPKADVEQAEERKPWEDVSAWTPEQRFMFDLEGELYKMVALAEILETLTTPITNGMARHNRPGAAALDYASTNLVDAVREIEERYMAVRFPDKQAA